jgi:hypothetical protein
MRFAGGLVRALSSHTVASTWTAPGVTKHARSHVWKAEEALKALAEIGPLLREVGAEVAWHGPSRWRGTGPELVLTVWPRPLRDSRETARMSPTRSR